MTFRTELYETVKSLNQRENPTLPKGVDDPAPHIEPGWWLRSMMPWVKRNSMPESVTDRPASAIEYVFLLSKSARYFFDIEAVRQRVAPSQEGRVRDDPIGGASWQERGQHSAGGRYKSKKPDGWDTGPGAHGTVHRGGREKGATSEIPTGRNPRNTDLFYESLANPHGLISNGDGEPLALDVNPAAFSAAHFATFPPALIVPLIKAGTSEKGCCPECGAPWVRVLGEKTPANGRGSGNKERKYRHEHGGNPDHGAHQGFGVPWSPSTTETTGWRPSCGHVYPASEAYNHKFGPLAPVAATVLDCFGGAGTVGLVADRLGRDAILIEAKPEYADMARKRIADDAGMFAEVG